MFALGRKLDQESLGHVELPGMLFKNNAQAWRSGTTSLLLQTLNQYQLATRLNMLSRVQTAVRTED
jgi:hypothetical protein